MSDIQRPGLWREVSIGEVCLQVDRVDPRKRDASTFRYVDISSVDNELKAITEPNDVESSAAPSRARQLIAKGDVLVSTVRPNLNAVALVPEELDGEICSTGFCVLRANRDLAIPAFLFLWVRTPEFVQRIMRYARGIGYPAVSDSDVFKVRLPLPSPSEQERIVTLLRHADRLRHVRREAQVRAEDIPLSLFAHIYGTPSEWEDMVALDDVVDFVGGGTPSRKVPRYFTGETPWATSKDVKSRYLDDAEEHITQEAIDKSATKPVPAGSILLVVKSKILAHSLPTSIISRPFCFGQDLKGLVCEEGVQPEFVVSALQIQKERILQSARGANTEGLTLDLLRSIPLPRVDERQDQFVDQLRAFNGIEDSLSASGSIADKLSTSLLYRAFTGELTEDWREARRDELQAAATERDALLGIERTVPVEEPDVPRTTAHPRRERLLETFTKELRMLLSLIGQAFQEKRYISAGSLAEEEELDGRGWSLRDVHEALTLFEQAALIQRARVEYAPTDEMYYVPAQRLLNEDQDEAHDLVKFIDFDAAF